MEFSSEVRSAIEHAVWISRPDALGLIEETGEIPGLQLDRSATDYACNLARLQRSYPLRITAYGTEHLNPHHPVAEVAISMLAERDLDRASIQNARGLRKDTQTGHRIADLSAVGVPLTEIETSESYRVLGIHAVQAASFYLPNHSPESPALKRLASRFKTGDVLFRSAKPQPPSTLELYRTNPNGLTYVGVSRTGLELRVETSWRDRALISELRDIGQIQFGDRIIGFRSEPSHASPIRRCDYDQMVDVYLSLNSRSIEELIDRTVPFGLLISRQISESMLKECDEIDATKSGRCAFIAGTKIMVDLFKEPDAPSLAELDASFDCRPLTIQDAGGNVVRSVRTMPLKSASAQRLVEFLNDNGFFLSSKIESHFGVSSKRRPPT